MITYSIIQKSQLEGALRIDAEYYKPEYLDINNQLTLLQVPVKKLKDLIVSPVVTGTTPKQRTCKDDGSDIKFIKTDVLRDGEIDFDSADCLPENQNRKLSQPKAGDILTTIIGADYPIVGRSALVYLDNPLMNINQNIVRIRPNKSLLPEYLISFIRSRFGILQLWQQSRQTEQVNLNCREVENIKVPVFPMTFQKLFVQMVIQAKKEKDSSISYYQQAESLLLKELGLMGFKSDADLWSVVNFSDIQIAGRLDADYFQPKYQEILKRIERFKTIKLADKNYFDIITGTYAKNYSLQGINYIRSVNIQDDLSIDSNDMYKTEESLGKKFKVKVGDIVTSRVGSIGTLGIISEEFEDSFISDNILRIRNSHKKLNDLFLAFYLKKIGSILMNRLSRGSVQQRLNQETLAEIVVPILLEQMQQKIAVLVRKSHEARKKSKKLLEEAKRKVEEMIEKGGEG